jgi:hypothetical protein
MKLSSEDAMTKISSAAVLCLTLFAAGCGANAPGNQNAAAAAAEEEPETGISLSGYARVGVVTGG